MSYPHQSTDDPPRVRELEVAEVGQLTSDTQIFGTSIRLDVLNEGIHVAVHGATVLDRRLTITVLRRSLSFQSAVLAPLSPPPTVAHVSTNPPRFQGCVLRGEGRRPLLFREGARRGGAMERCNDSDPANENDGGSRLNSIQASRSEAWRNSQEPCSRLKDRFPALTHTHPIFR